VTLYNLNDIGDDDDDDDDDLSYTAQLYTLAPNANVYLLQVKSNETV